MGVHAQNSWLLTNPNLAALNVNAQISGANVTVPTPVTNVANTQIANIRYFANSIYANDGYLHYNAPILAHSSTLYPGTIINSGLNNTVYFYVTPATVLENAPQRTNMVYQTSNGYFRYNGTEPCMFWVEVSLDAQQADPGTYVYFWLTRNSGGTITKRISGDKFAFGSNGLSEMNNTVGEFVVLQPLDIVCLTFWTNKAEDFYLTGQQPQGTNSYANNIKFIPITNSRVGQVRGGPLNQYYTLGVNNLNQVYWKAV